MQQHSQDHQSLSPQLLSPKADLQAEQCGNPLSASLGATIAAGCVKDRLKKRKYIRKNVGLLFRTVLLPQLSAPHVFNFLGMVSVNERTLKDGSYQESYYRSMFYIRSVEKVELRKQALLVFTRSIDQPTPTHYLIDRLLSHGDASLQQLAETIQTTDRLFGSVDFRKQLSECCESEPLARFIDSMGERTYMCKVAPNKLLISRKLLQFLGQDPETYAIRICKHRTPTQEIIPGYHYSSVITKSIQSVGLLCQFLKGELSLQELQEQTVMEFNDYLIARDRRVFCRFRLSMPSPLVSCFQVKEVLGKVEERSQQDLDLGSQNRLQQEMTSHQYDEAKVLSQLISLPSSLDPAHRHRLAGYIVAQ